MKNLVFVGNANRVIEGDYIVDKTQLSVSQQPTLIEVSDASADVALSQHFMAGYVQATEKWMQDIWQLEQARRDQSDWAKNIICLSENVTSMQEKLNGLAEAVDRLSSLRTFVVPLTTLASEPLQMKLNIPATIEGDGEDFTATFNEANVSASGETEADAIANLKESLVSTYEFLESIPENEMGLLPARQWEVLRNVLTR